MGLRGPKAGVNRLVKRERQPWEADGLLRHERVIAFVESLNITSGAHAGSKFLLRPWQKKIVEAWYATDRRGRRIVRTGILTLGRKNGKTSLCAALALAHLVGPEVEPRGQVIAAAKDRDQSALIFDELVAFIQDNPQFTARTNIQRHAKIIEDLESGTKFRALSSDAPKAHGLNPSVVIVDELAQWGGTPAGRDLYAALATATGARAEPLALIISTQTPDEHNVMTELLTYGREVLAGRIEDPTFSTHIFEVPLEADPWDEQNWPLANPALDDFRSLEEMRTFAFRAKSMPAQGAWFRAYYLNQPIRAENFWFDLDRWDECASPGTIISRGRRCYAGLDLASRGDLTALALWFPNEEDDTWDLRIECWCPRDAIAERSRRDRVPYIQWVEDGWLHATPGDSTDYAFIEKRIYELMDEYEIAELGCDPWNARDLLTRLQQNGVPVVEIQQTLANLTAPSKAFEMMILSRKLRHQGSPLVRWAVGNCVALIDANENIRPDKKRSREKIDPVVAAITGLRQALIQPPEPKISVWR